MKLKYNIWALSLMGAMAVACDPMDDIYNEIDAEGTVVVKTIEEYVLTEDDYAQITKSALKDAATDEEKALANAVKNDLALNSFATAEKYVPGIISAMVPSWGQGSSVGVTYNFQNDPSSFVTEVRTVQNAYLANKDYEALWGEGSPVKFLAPSHAPETVLPAWLLENRKDAEKGDLVLMDYKYDDVDPQFTGEEIYSQNFEGVEAKAPIALEGWHQVMLEGDLQWEGREYSGNKYAQYSAYGYDGKVDAWLVSPAIAIDTKDASLAFDICFGHYNADCFDVLVSDQAFDASALKADDWTSLKAKFTLPDGPASSYGKLASAGKASLAQYEGKTIRVAFRYTGEGPKKATTTVQIDNVSVSSAVLAPTTEKPYSVLYSFDGEAWGVKEDSRLTVVTPADYDAMGNPGSHDNFSESDAPVNYLPQFLAQKFPYAQEGDAQAVMYKYYANKKTTLEVDEYLFEGGAWVLNNNVERKEKVNFVCSSKGWMFDPTVTKSLAAADYLILENWVKANKPAGYMDQKYGNSEYWFGGSSYYLNFNVQLSKRRSNDPDGVVPADDTEAEAYLMKMVQEGIELILATQYADAGAQISGVDCYYVITAKIYNGLETIPYTYRFKGLGNGKFELEGDPVAGE